MVCTTEPGGGVRLEHGTAGAIDADLLHRHAFGLGLGSPALAGGDEHEDEQKHGCRYPGSDRRGLLRLGRTGP